MRKFSKRDTEIVQGCCSVRVWTKVDKVLQRLIGRVKLVLVTYRRTGPREFVHTHKGLISEQDTWTSVFREN